jgi:diadenosine tetraphosphate (Ap4A) HIT family hydrolase
MSDCHTCDLSARRAAGAAPPWDNIVRTPTWDVAHAFGTDVEGWLVLVVRRHITSVADLTDAEAAELGPLIKRVSAALQEVVGCEKTYVVQFAEHPNHPHVHVHVIARPVDLAAEHRGPRIFAGRSGLPDEECVPEPRMNEIAAAVRSRLEIGN